MEREALLVAVVGLTAFFLVAMRIVGTMVGDSIDGARHFVERYKKQLEERAARGSEE